MDDQTRLAECIIVADAEILERHAISDYLRKCGYTVIEAASSDEVVSVLEEPGLSISIILCDARIKGDMNAFSLRQWVRERHGHVEVALSASTEGTAQTAANICDQGADLGRPYDPEMVIAYIKRLKGRSTPRSEG